MSVIFRSILYPPWKTERYSTKKLCMIDLTLSLIQKTDFPRYTFTFLDTGSTTSPLSKYEIIWINNLFTFLFNGITPVWFIFVLHPNINFPVVTPKNCVWVNYFQYITPDPLNSLGFTLLPISFITPEHIKEQYLSPTTAKIFLTYYVETWMKSKGRVKWTNFSSPFVKSQHGLRVRSDTSVSFIIR